MIRLLNNVVECRGIVCDDRAYFHAHFHIIFSYYNIISYYRAYFQNGSNGDVAMKLELARSYVSSLKIAGKIKILKIHL